MVMFSGDVDLTGAAYTVGAGALAEWNPNVTTTVLIDKNFVVDGGVLRMRPANRDVDHILRFVDVDEEAFVGGSVGGMSMVPVASDVGLWVVGNSLWDVRGTPKVGWNRTGFDPSWEATDELVRGPWAIGDYGQDPGGVPSYRAHTLGQAPESLVCPYGHTHTNEVFNLTRNVRIEGTAGHKSHALVMTPGVTQTIEYVAFQHMGPRKVTGDSNISAEVRGRWAGVHFHHLGNAYSTVARGCVARDGGSHSYVVHGSHGVTLDDCISYGMNEDAFWWDKEALSDASHDVSYLHCGSWKLVPIPSFRGTQLCHFLLLKDTGTVIDCVGAGNMGGQNSGAFIWPEQGGNHFATGTDLWVNHGNVGHNNRELGSFFWQNNNTQHEVIDLTAFRNGTHGIRHGSYRNAVKYSDFELFENGEGDLNLLATNAQATPLQQMYSDPLLQTVLIEEHQLLNISPPVRVQNARAPIESVTIAEFLTDSKGAGAGEYDFVRCGLETNDFSIIAGGSGTTARGMNPGSVIRVQRDDNTAFKVTSVTGSSVVIDVIPPFAIYVSTVAISQATQGVVFSQQLVQQLGSGAVTWGLRTGSGPLPPGMALSAGGVLSGTPTAAGSYPITVQATDASGYVAPKALTVLVGATASLQITTSSLPNAVIGTPYSQTLASSGGFPSYTYSLIAGSLPPGLNLSSAGVISGTPTAAGVSSMTFRVTDSVSATAQRVLSITTQDLSPVITTSALSLGEVGLAYSDAMTATGGVPPYTYSVLLGPLPPGVFLASNGTFSGTPTTLGDYPVRIRVTDSGGYTAQRDYSITVYAALSLPPPAFPAGVVGQSYAEVVAVIGGAPPIVFSQQSPDLPPGLTISTSGVVSGIPTEVGTYTFDVVVFDGLSATDTEAAVITVALPQVMDEIERNAPNAFVTRSLTGGSRVRDRVS